MSQRAAANSPLTRRCFLRGADVSPYFFTWQSQVEPLELQPLWVKGQKEQGGIRSESH